MRQIPVLTNLVFAFVRVGFVFYRHLETPTVSAPPRPFVRHVSNMFMSYSPRHPLSYSHKDHSQTVRPPPPTTTRQSAISTRWWMGHDQPTQLSLSKEKTKARNRRYGESQSGMQFCDNVQQYVFHTPRLSSLSFRYSTTTLVVAQCEPSNLHSFSYLYTASPPCFPVIWCP